MLTAEEYNKIKHKLKYIASAQISYNPTGFIEEFSDNGRFRFFIDYRGYMDRNDVDELSEYEIYDYGDAEFFKGNRFELTEKNVLSVRCINWIKDYFTKTDGKTAVIGISGGKDSTVVAALCKEALGPENVIGVMMPNGIQSDIEDARRVCKILGINSQTIDISSVYNVLKQSIYNADPKLEKLSDQCLINLAPRLRMTCLYGIAQNVVGGRIAGTGNLSERMLGYSTLWGDSACDFNPIGNLLVSEVLQIGDELNMPYELVHKVPTDGLTGKTDEQNLGFTYNDFERFYRRKTNLSSEVYDKILKRIEKYSWKTEMIHVPMFVK